MALPDPESRRPGLWRTDHRRRRWERGSGPFDCHDTSGHWHKGGYDRLGRPGNSHTDSPESLVRVADQVEFALAQIKDNAAELLAVGEAAEAAKLLDAAMVDKALEGIRAHLARNSGLRVQAIADKLIEA